MDELKPWQKVVVVALIVVWFGCFFGVWAAAWWLYGWRGAAVGWMPALLVWYALGRALIRSKI